MGGLVDRGGVLNCQFGCSFVDLIPCKTVFHVCFGPSLVRWGRETHKIYEILSQRILTIPQLFANINR